MDPALLREIKSFKKCALSNPVIESKKKDVSAYQKKNHKTESTPTKPKDLIYKNYGGSSQGKFKILFQVIKHMKQRHLNGDTYPLSLEEILDETNQLHIGQLQRNWLMNEALANNPKLQVDDNGKYVFKPPINIKDRQDLLRLLKEHNKQGLGGIMFDDIQELLPNAEKILKRPSVIQITQPKSKKKVLFYNDISFQLNVDDKFQKLWKSVALDGLDEDEIEVYLQKQGITSMKVSCVKNVTAVPKRKKPSSSKRNFKKLNQHNLQDYSERN